MPRQWYTVATTSAGRVRFKVGDKNFHKKLVLASDDKTLKTLYIGSSPGYRQIYVRRQGEDNVYAVKIDNYEISTDNSQWLEATLLRPAGEIADLRGAGFELQKVDGKWKEASGSGQVVTDEVDKLTGVLKRLRVIAAVDMPKGDPVYVLHVNSAENDYTYRFYEQGDKHYITRNDYDLGFEINKPDFERIVGATAKTLIKGLEGDQNTSLDGSQHSLAPVMPASWA